MALAYASRRLLGQLRSGPVVVSFNRFFQSSTAPCKETAKGPAPVPLSKLKDSFNDATSVTYLEELEKRYQHDPKSVDRTWASFFKNLGGC